MTPRSTHCLAANTGNFEVTEKNTPAGWLSRAGNSARNALSVWALTVLVIGASWPFLEDRIRGFAKSALGLEETGGGPCLKIPDHPTGGIVQHTIDPVAPGDWGVVNWRDIERLRDDCGEPRVIATISNGGGILHRAPLSIGDGIDLPMGQQDLSYLFHVHEFVERGAGFFRVTVSFPDAHGGSPSEQSPWVPFLITED